MDRRSRTLRATSLMGRWKLALSTSSVMLLDWPHPRFCDGKMRVGQRRGWGSTEVGRVVGRAARATTSATGVRGPRWRSPDGDGKKRPCDSSCRRRCAPFVATTRQRDNRVVVNWHSLKVRSHTQLAPNPHAFSPSSTGPHKSASVGLWSCCTPAIFAVFGLGLGVTGGGGVGIACCSCPLSDG